MLNPLTQFICDTCGEIINSPKEGWIEWISPWESEDDKRLCFDFRIVHHLTSSPLGINSNDGCYQHTDAIGRSDLNLDNFTNKETGMAHILKFLDVGPYHEQNYEGPYIKDMREYVEIIRRLTIPYYEEARLYWSQALEDGYFDDANEVWMYKTDNLKQLIGLYSNKQ